MLISHKKNFIYFKTIKTAGTTVEIFFEKECIPSEVYTRPSERTKQIMTDDGIVGSRCKREWYGKIVMQNLIKRVFTEGVYNNYFNPQWYSHMSASEIRWKIGEDKFQDYFKFCVIRNPFDKVISYWWHVILKKERSKMYNMDFLQIKKCFLDWVKSTKKIPIDRNIYSIDGQLVMDYCIRFENLENGIKEVCSILELDFDYNRIGKYKSAFRLPEHPYHDYYDQEAIEKIQRIYQWECEKFNYSY